MKANGIELEKEILDQLPAIVIAVDKNFGASGYRVGSLGIF